MGFRVAMVGMISRGYSGSSPFAYDDPDLSTNGRMLPIVQHWRLFFAMAMFVICYATVGLRLIDLANMSWNANFPEGPGLHDGLIISRPDIVDRHGKVLATDIKTPSLFANPRSILDKREAIDSLLQVFPSLDRRALEHDLAQDRAFVFIKRELTPSQQARVYELGIPGLGFVQETRRIYPAGDLAAHILGVVGVDHGGLSGVEMYIDRQDLRNSAVEQLALSLDFRVQYAVQEELSKAMVRYSAKAATGIVFDVHTGEIIAGVSLPGFDPNTASDAFCAECFNRFSSGVFEMGSSFKIFTTAMALDFGVADLQSRYDAREPIRVSSYKIDDFHAQRRILSVPEIFVHSSNIGSAKMALDVGVRNHKNFLRRLGLLDRLDSELPEGARPLLPAHWTELSTMTIAFGHGLSVTPLQLVRAAAALVNGGRLVGATFLKRDQAVPAEQVLRPGTSDVLRYLMRLNVREGTATKADIPGYLIGGKTGTAEKNINGHYVKNRLLTSFIGAFPMDEPRYTILIVLDEPQPLKDTHGYATAGWNAAPVAGRVVERIAPLLSILPRKEKDSALMVSSQ